MKKLIAYMKKMIREKRGYRRMMARAGTLPEDYYYVFDKIQHYMWNFAAGDGFDMTRVQSDLLDLFEEGVADGKDVLDITGEDVAAFSDELLANARTYTEKWRMKLNRDIHDKLRKGE